MLGARSRRFLFALTIASALGAAAVACAQDDDALLPPIESGDESERENAAERVDREGRLVDLNRATREEIAALPLPPDVAEALWERREFVDFFRDLSDVAEVEGMTPELLAAPDPWADRARTADVRAAPQGRPRLSLRVLGRRGGHRRVAGEFYKDLALDPIDVNTASLLDLQNMQGVSPVDAVAIWNHRKIAGKTPISRRSGASTASRDSAIRTRGISWRTRSRKKIANCTGTPCALRP